jgi:hypothetical protein
MSLYTYGVYRDGRLIVSSKPMPEDQARAEVEKYSASDVKVYVDEYEPYDGSLDLPDFQD